MKITTEVTVKVDIVTSDDIKIYYTGKFQDFTVRYIIKWCLALLLKSFQWYHSNNSLIYEMGFSSNELGLLSIMPNNTPKKIPRFRIRGRLLSEASNCFILHLGLQEKFPKSLWESRKCC